MSRFTRSSKFRHVFGTAAKRDLCYDNIRITKSPNETNMCAVNSKFIAVVLEAQGGGSFMVAPLSKVGRFDINYPKVSGHKSQVLDINWNPFDDKEIASCSEDATVMLWEIPDDGLVDNLSTPLQTLSGHQRKVMFVLWHPCAENVLASASADNTVFIWNTKTGEILYKLNAFPDQIQSISWSYNGTYIASTCKDHKLRVFDVRKQEVISEGKCHDGTKPSRVTFCGPKNKLFTTGFSRMSERQYAFWDPADLSKALTMENIDSSSGVQFPFYDNGTKMVYLIGKGDTQIRYFEITDDKPYVFFLSMYQSNTVQRGCGYMPKRHLDYMHCEVARFYKLQHTKGLVEPLSMTVPRKSEMFQDDIFPPCEAGIPALTAEEWVSGMDKDPRLVSFTVDGLIPAPASAELLSKPIGAAGAKKRLPSGSSAEPSTLEEYRAAYKKLLAENERLKKQLESK